MLLEAHLEGRDFSPAVKSVHDSGLQPLKPSRQQNNRHPERSEGSAFHAPEATLTREENVR
jgi:hypothetical protein